MAWNFSNMFSGMGKTVPWLSGATGVLQAPQLQSTLKSVTSIIPSAGSTILVPAGVVSRSVYDTLSLAGQTYGQVNKYNPMVVSAANIYQPNTISNLNGFKLQPVSNLKQFVSPQFVSPPRGDYADAPSLSIDAFPRSSGLSFYPGMGSMISKSRPIIKINSPLIPSLGSYVFGNASISLPWSKPKARKQKYSKKKTQRKHCATKSRRRKY